MVTYWGASAPKYNSALGCWYFIAKINGKSHWDLHYPTKKDCMEGRAEWAKKVLKSIQKLKTNKHVTQSKGH